MKRICRLFWRALVGSFQSRASLHAEVLTLRQQLNVLQRKLPLWLKLDDTLEVEISKIGILRKKVVAE